MRDKELYPLIEAKRDLYFQLCNANWKEMSHIENQLRLLLLQDLDMQKLIREGTTGYNPNPSIPNAK